MQAPHRTEAAGPGTTVPQNHERRSTAVEAFVEVRAAGRFADSVETETWETAFQIVQRAGMPLRFAKPIRQPASPLKLDQRALHGSVSSHDGSVEAGLLQVRAGFVDGVRVR